MRLVKVLLLAMLVPAYTYLSAQQTPKQTTKANLKGSAAAGKLVYKKYCLTCHQADGGGVPNMNPPLTQTSYVLGDKNRLIKIVLNGLSEKIEINDETYSNIMPAQSQLTDKQVADVLTYVRSSFGNKADAVSVAEVKALRK